MPWNPDGTRKKPSSYTMKYQGNTSAFPFKSPIHDHEKDSDGKIIQHSDITDAALSGALVGGAVNQPHTKKKSEEVERKKGLLEDKIDLTTQNKQKIEELRAKMNAGEITNAQFREAVKEIKGYVNPK